KKLPFNFLRDIAPVAGITRVPNVMEVNPNFPAKTVAEFITYGKANPGKINMASSGNGTSVHLSGELFMAMTGVKMTHVPYRGGGAGHHGFDARPHRRAVRQRAALDRIHKTRKAACAGGQEGRSKRGAAGCAGRRRWGAGLGGGRLVGHGGAKRHARQYRR